MINTKQPLILFSFLLVAFILSGCGKKGCTDPDAENLDHEAERDDGSCKYRYVSSIDVLSFPTLDGNGNQWDVGGAPDIYVRFKKASSSSWDYITNTATDTYAPASLIIGSGIKFTNEDWQFELMDYDWPSNDDPITSATFNPLKTGSGGSINVQTPNGTNINFRYTLNN